MPYLINSKMLAEMKDLGENGNIKDVDGETIKNNNGIIYVNEISWTQVTGLSSEFVSYKTFLEELSLINEIKADRIELEEYVNKDSTDQIVYSFCNFESGIETSEHSFIKYPDGTRANIVSTKYFDFIESFNLNVTNYLTGTTGMSNIWRCPKNDVSATKISNHLINGNRIVFKLENNSLPNLVFWNEIKTEYDYTIWDQTDFGGSVDVWLKLFRYSKYGAAELNIIGGVMGGSYRIGTSSDKPKLIVNVLNGYMIFTGTDMEIHVNGFGIANSLSGPKPVGDVYITETMNIANRPSTTPTGEVIPTSYSLKVEVYKGVG